MTHNGSEKSGKNLSWLVLGALGVVYGDIGTSPLYAMRECFGGGRLLPATEPNVLGVLSLVVWALILVISVKYMVFVMRADNRGEGGILALMVLALSRLHEAAPRLRFSVIVIGLFGAALLYGDGMITPAISVLSAVEGLSIITPVFDVIIIPVTIVILTGLFLVQRHGTARIGAAFGPIILIWFAAIGCLGLFATLERPGVYAAVSPHYALNFFLHHRAESFHVLGSVFLVVTGGEALYADMGHFGSKSIKLGWFYVALPALLINYLGQGAVILCHPETIENPFYGLAPHWALWPLVALATAATIIASQAVITGAFSLTRQAILLGYLPRMGIRHTSAHAIGQVYIPAVNYFLFLATIGLVLGFKTSSNLAAAYGVAVTTTMVITTLLLFVVAKRVWGWNLLPTIGLTALFLVFDLSFCGASLLKFFHGGWFPLLIGVVIFILMTTWRRGRELLRDRIGTKGLSFDQFVRSVTEVTPRPNRVHGAAVFLSGSPEGTPVVLLHNLKYNRILHETTAVLSILIEETPHVPDAEKVVITNFGEGFYRIVARCGFMESPNVPYLIQLCKKQGLALDSPITGFFLGRENIKSTAKPGMARWREHLFSLMSKNAHGAIGFFEIPPNQVVELGVQVEL